MESNETPKDVVANPSMTQKQLQSDIDTIKTVLSESDKENEIHRILIAGGNLLCGFFILIAVPVILLAVGVVGVAAPPPDPGVPSPTLVVGTVAIFVLAVICLLSLPFFLAAWGVWKRKSWGVVVAVVTGILNLTNLPFGTALAIYTFWAVTKGKLGATT